MVNLLLSIKADLENVTSLVPASDDFEYFFQVKCNSCHEIHPKLVAVNRLEKRQMSGSKGATANFVWRCGMCKRESSAKFDAASPPQPYTEENGQFGPLVVIECRGLEFVDFQPRGIWKCVGNSGTIFTDVNLEDGDWVDYDEKAALPVGISGFECKWSRDDQIVTVLPIHYSNFLVPNIQIHQFPLLTRPLQVPPSAALSGKRIRARIKPVARRLEVHVPVDTRPEVWNSEKGKLLGAVQMEDDKEKNQESSKGKLKEGEEPRLADARMRSERIQQKGAHMLGIVRDGQLHLHPINETHQLRPTLTYLDILSRKSKRSRGGASDSDSDDGPPPDPDEPALPSVLKKEKKPSGEAREVQVSARRADDKGMQPNQGGLSTVRREMLAAIRTEEDESWEDLEYFDGETEVSGEVFETVFSQSGQLLECKTGVTTFLQEIAGL